MFRSRGIRLDKGKTGQYSTKLYYDDEQANHNEIIDKFIGASILEVFEYATDMCGNIVAYNLHNNPSVDGASLYSKLSKENYLILNNIPNIIDSRLKNYTTGFRVDGDSIKNIVYYFYPTIKTPERYKIKGIDNKSEIAEIVKKIIDYFELSGAAQRELMEISDLSIKFKGISVEFSSTINEIKIYLRIPTKAVYTYLKDIIKETDFIKFGDVVLFSVRIVGKNVVGYNIYYLR